MGNPLSQFDDLEDEVSPVVNAMLDTERHNVSSLMVGLDVFVVSAHLKLLLESLRENRRLVEILRVTPEFPNGLHVLFRVF